MRSLLLAILLLPSLCLGQGFGVGSAPFLLSTSSLRRGLVGYWRMEEVASSIRYDSSALGNNLTIKNSCGQAAGLVGNCATFASASTQGLQNGGTSYRFGNHDFTCAGWVRFTTIQTTYPVIAGVYRFSDNNRSWMVYYDKDVPGIAFAISTNGVASKLVGTGSTPSTNTWYSFAAWYNYAAGSLNIQLNNGATNSVALPLGPAVGISPFTVGIEGGFGQALNGAVDELGVWNRILTASERTFLYNSGRGTHFPWVHP